MRTGSEDLPIDDIAALLELATGNRHALRTLYDRYSARVYNTAVSYLQSAEEAEEATQDVFLELAASASRFEQRSSVSTWIYRLTVNQCLDRLRYRNRKKRRAKLLSIFGDKGELLHDVATFEHPGIAMEKQEDARHLFAAIDELPERQKTAFVLTYVEELSGKEVAEVMGLTVKGVESLIQRAKANLRKILEKE